MFITRQRERVSNFYHAYPRQFWLIILASFIDRLGGALVAVFMAVYITEKFDIGLSKVGILFGIFSITSMVGNFVGGALTDKMGRKGIIIFSLVVSATSSLALGIISDFTVLAGFMLIAGVFSDTGGPAMQAMIADILPEEKRSEGYSIMRVAINLSWVGAPVLGSILAQKSYMPIFVFDAITSCIMASVVFFFLRETLSQHTEANQTDASAATPNVSMSLSESFKGYRLVLRDMAFMLFIVINMLVQLVYMQLYTTLPVYLRDEHGIPAQHYGYLMSINAALVIFLQVGLARKVHHYPPLLMIALGCVCYVIGFSMYGLVGGFALFALAMIIITFGEMITFPVGQAVVAQMSPEDKRGRYMALYGFSFAIPSIFGVWLAGQIMERGNPNLVWYLGGVLAAIATTSYLYLYRSTHPTPADSPLPSEMATEAVS